MITTACRALPCVALLLCLCCPAPAARAVHHYVFFDRERERITERSFLDNPAFEGAQLKYTWRELEPQKDRYDFAPLRHDLEVLAANHKKLFVQLQDVSFDVKIVNVPEYLTRDAEYHGGAEKQYAIENDDEAKAVPEGWVARRWDPAVRTRFHKLLAALGAEFDGKIEGINLPETAVTFGESGRLFPAGFSPTTYRDGVIANMEALRRAFPHSVAMQYANFMPGEWLPTDDKSYLRSVYRRAAELKLAVGGPDLLPGRPGQMNHAYRMIAEFRGAAPTGIAVQWGNYEHRDPRSGRMVTIPDLVRFAADDLRIDYLFWCTQEPYYSEHLLPFLRRVK